MSKTYGSLGWAQSDSGLAFWGMEVLPHVAIKAKRLFPRIDQGRTGMLAVLDTPEFAADLTWFISRYPLDMADDVRERLAAQTEQHRLYSAAVERILDGKQTLDEFPPPAREPRSYQQQGAELAYLTGGLLLGDEVGLGKTQTALMLLRDPTTLPALIVVPTHLPKQWVREIKAVMPHLTPHVITKGSPVVRDRAGHEKPYDTRGADVLVISYSKLGGWRDVLAGEIKTVIFDEVQELRRTGTIKYDAAAQVADKADRRMGLSATPIYNYGGEAFNIFEVLKPGVLGTRSEFLREWGGATMGTGQVVVNDPKGLGAFMRDQGLLLRRTRAEVGRELPEPVEDVITIPSTTDAVDAAMTDIVRLAEQVLHGPTREDRFVAGGQIDMRLRQATGLDKAPYVAEWVRLLLDSEEKVVLFGWHRAVYDIWLRQLADFRPTMYTGTESPKQKDDSVQRFINDDACRVFICSLRSGAGVDGLQEAASVAVFGELDWSPAMHHQAIGRLARDGQPNAVAAFYLVSDVGSDPIISGVLEAKRQQSEPFMVGDGETALFTAQADTGRSKALARAILTKAGRAVD